MSDIIEITYNPKQIYAERYKRQLSMKRNLVILNPEEADYVEPSSSDEEENSKSENKDSVSVEA